MRKIIVYIVLLLVVFIGGYIYIFYYNQYDSGYREGVLYSFSRKGNVFKTYEGIMIQPGLRSARTGGLNTNEFHFSVSDAAVADSLERCIGMQVKVHYRQYRRNLPWRGENNNNDNKEKGQYMVDDIVSAAPADNGYNNGLY